MLWWFAVFAAYVVTVCAQTGSEIVAGAIIAALCSIVAIRALQCGEPAPRAKWAWLGHLAGVPSRMVADAFLVSRRIVWALVNGEKLAGYMTRIPYDVGDRSDGSTMGREALVIYGISAAPNSIVTDIDERGELVLHKLVASEQPAASRQWPL